MKKFYKDLTNVFQFGILATMLDAWAGATLFCAVKGYDNSIMLESLNLEYVLHFMLLLKFITSISFSWKKEDGTKVKSWNYSCFK